MTHQTPLLEQLSPVLVAGVCLTLFAMVPGEARASDCAPRPTKALTHVIAPGKEGPIQELLAPPGDPTPAPWSVAGIQIEQDRINVFFDGEHPVTATIIHPSTPCPECLWRPEAGVCLSSRVGPLERWLERRLEAPGVAGFWTTLSPSRPERTSEPVDRGPAETARHKPVQPFSRGIHLVPLLILLVSLLAIGGGATRGRGTGLIDRVRGLVGWFGQARGEGRFDQALMLVPAVFFVAVVGPLMGRPFPTSACVYRVATALALDTIELIDFVPRLDPQHGLVNFFVLKWAGWFGHTEWIMRVPNLIAGMAAVVLFYLVVTRSASRFTGLVAAVVLGSFGVVIDYVLEINDHLPFLAWLLFSHYAFVRYVVDGRPGWKVSFMASHVLLPYFQPFGLLLLFAEFAWLVGRGQHRRWLRAYFILGVTSLFEVVSLVRYLLQHALGTAPGTQHSQLSQANPDHFWGWRETAATFFEFYDVISFGSHWVFFLGVIPGLLVLVTRFWRDGRGAWVLYSVLTLLSMAVLAQIHRTHARYLVSVYPLAVWAIVLAPAAYRAGLKRLKLPPLLVSWVAGIAMAGLLVLPARQVLAVPDVAENDIREIAAALQETGHGQVIVEPIWLTWTLAYYLDADGDDFVRVADGCLPIFGPGGSMVRCLVDGNPLISLAGETAATWSLAGDLANLKSLPRPYSFYYKRTFENEALRRYLEETCAVVGQWGDVVVFGCESSAGAPAGPGKPMRERGTRTGIDR